MGRYCITAANHQNPTNHCTSTFNVWESCYDPEKKKRFWKPLEGKSIYYIADLLKNGHDVFTAQYSESESEKSITLGARVEIELRIAKNETDFKISNMPGF